MAIDSCYWSNYKIQPNQEKGKKEGKGREKEGKEEGEKEGKRKVFLIIFLNPNPNFIN